MVDVWSLVRTPVKLAGIALAAILLLLGPFDPSVSGSRDDPVQAGVLLSSAEVSSVGADPAAWRAFTDDLQGYSSDVPRLVSLGQADCDVWREGVLPVGTPAATEGQDVADPQADAIATAAHQHLCPELS